MQVDTFDDARQILAQAWPDYDIAAYGYETDENWILLLLPERAGGRVPLVDKQTGTIRWVSAFSDEYSQERPVGDQAARFATI